MTAPTGIQNSDSSEAPREPRPDFIPLPSDPRLLTPEQLRAICGGDLRALKDLLRLADKKVAPSR